MSPTRSARDVLQAGDDTDLAPVRVGVDTMRAGDRKPSASASNSCRRPCAQRLSLRERAVDHADERDDAAVLVV